MGSFCGCITVISLRGLIGYSQALNKSVRVLCVSRNVPFFTLVVMFDEIFFLNMLHLIFINHLLPGGNSMPSSLCETKKMIKKLRLDCKKIYVCHEKKIFVQNVKYLGGNLLKGQLKAVIERCYFHLIPNCLCSLMLLII